MEAHDDAQEKRHADAARKRDRRPFLPPAGQQTHQVEGPHEALDHEDREEHVRADEVAHLRRRPAAVEQHRERHVRHREQEDDRPQRERDARSPHREHEEEPAVRRLDELPVPLERAREVGEPEPAALDGHRRAAMPALGRIGDPDAAGVRHGDRAARAGRLAEKILRLHALRGPERVPRRGPVERERGRDAERDAEDARGERAREGAAPRALPPPPYDSEERRRHEVEHAVGTDRDGEPERQTRSRGAKRSQSAGAPRHEQHEPGERDGVRRDVAREREAPEVHVAAREPVARE